MLSGTVLPLFLAAFSFCSIFFPVTAFATPDGSSPPPPGKVILFLIDALDVETFISSEWIHLRRLASRGVIGLMNSRTASTPSSTIPAAAHVTLGAGDRASAGNVAGYGANVDEEVYGLPAGVLYETTLGFSRPSAGIVFLGLPQLEEAAATQREGARPGTLGKDVAALGGRVAMIGNGDVVDGTALSPQTDAAPALLPRRHGVLVAMDDRGYIPLGTVGQDTLTADDTWPFRWRTDYGAVWDVFTDVYDESALIVIELGDFARLDSLAERISKEQLDKLRRETVQRIDEWFGRLAGWPRAAGATILVVTPSPPAAALRNNFLLTPFATFPLDPTNQVGRVPALATGPTTRRAGIVTNRDIAPFILTTLLSPAGAGTNLPEDGPIYAATTKQFLRDIPPTVRPPTDEWEKVGWLYGRMTETHRLRPPVVQTFITSAIVLFALWTAWMIYLRGSPHPASSKAFPPWRIPLLLLSATPLAMLWLPLLAFPTRFSEAGGFLPPGIRLIVLVAIMATASHGVQRWLEGQKRRLVPGDKPQKTALAVIVISLVTALALIIDVWTGSSFMKSSVLGYDPIIGARYYGIGNEYMGVFVGTTLIGTTGLLDAAVKKRLPGPALAAVGILYTFVCITVAGPNLGANVGGTVAAVVGCSVTFVLLHKGRFPWKAIFFIALLLGLFIGGAALFDMVTPGPASHLGKTVQLVRQEGRQPLFTIALRKLAMNAKLLRWTIWAQVFVVSLAVSALALYRPSQRIRRLETNHPHLLHGIRGSVVAALVALLANDSGVVAAATMMIPVTATFMYVIVLDIERDDKSGSEP